MQPQKSLDNVFVAKSKIENRVEMAVSRALDEESLGHLDLRRIRMNEGRIQYATTCIESSNGQISKLNMAHCQLETFEANLQLLCQFFATTTLESIDLSYNWIGPDWLGQLVQSFRRNPNIQHLRLRHMNMEGASSGIHLASLLKDNTFLQRLKLAKNRRLGLEGARALASGLKANEHLQELDLGGCQMGDEAATVVVKALIGHPQLQKLVLSRNQLSLKCVFAITEMLSSTKSRITSLDVSFNSELFGPISYVPALDDEFNMDDDSNQIGNIPSRTTPEQKVASKGFGDAIQNHKYLKELCLSYCDICGECSAPLLKGLQVNKSLQKLDILCNRFGEVGYHVLLESMANMAGLVEMHVSCSYPQSLVKEFGHAMVRNQTIRRLLLTSDSETADLSKNLQRCLQKNRALVEFHKNPESPAQHWIPVIQALGFAVVLDESEPSMSVRASSVFQVLRQILPPHAQHCNQS